jgi:hypothetical protein
MATGKFVTAINCMDGRTQEPVINFLKEKYDADYVDMITEPGPVKILAEGEDKLLVESIKQRVLISTQKHGSKVIAVVGHSDCAGNPEDKMMQLVQIAGSISAIDRWNLGTETVGLWVDENWQVSQV